MKKRVISCILAVVLLVCALSGCGGKKTAGPEVDTSKPVTLRIVSAWEDFPAMEAVGNLFCKEYPNCTIEYEYLQDYYASLEKRLASGENTIDLFITTNVQDDSKLLPYALDLYSVKEIDLSSTFEGLIKNFEFQKTENNEKKLYAVPLGAEIRGMYVNVTLLKSLGLSVPKNSSELMDVCKVLEEKGYVAMQGNPGQFGQQLMYPYICNLIANASNYKKTYETVNNREEGVSELFREPMNVLYEIVKNKYYNYKYVEDTYKTFTSTSNEDYSRFFLNIVKSNDGYAKADDKGLVAFMPAPMSMGSTLEKTKSDYHSEIEYEFILSPVGTDGGYAYMSPAHGIAINKNSENLAWAELFLNFLFTPKNNETFAAKHSIIENTKDASKLIEKQFNIPESHISHLGEVTFDYGFYNLINKELVEVSKANNPKYMTTDADGNAVMYDLEYYMKNLEKLLTTK